MTPQTSMFAGSPQESNTWIDLKYATRNWPDPFMSLKDAEKETGFFAENMTNGYKNYLREATNDCLADVVKKAYIDKHGMNLTEAEAVAIYTYDFGPDNMEKNPYYVVNKFLRERDESLVNKYLAYIIYLLRGLRKLEAPKSDVLYRGVKSGISFDSDNYCVGKDLYWDSFTSTTCDIAAVDTFINDAPNPVIFEIRGNFFGVAHSVEALSFHPEEKEVIIEPGVHFRVDEICPYVNGSTKATLVRVSVVPGPRVLAGAVQFFTAEEGRRAYRVLPADVVHFRAAGFRMANVQWSATLQALFMCNNIDNVIPLFKDASWFPDLFMGFFAQYANTPMKAKLLMLVASFTRMFMPTLSEIKDGKANTMQYGIFQCSNDPSKTGAVSFVGAPCGVSIKIPEPQPTIPQRRFSNTAVYVIRADTMEVIKQVHAAFRQSKVACLNMGGQDRPGGGWKMGVFSLEELLFMRTTLSASLEDYLYPMKNFECIYTKDVEYIRNGVNEGFRFLAPNERFKFDVVTTCAFNLRKAVFIGAQKQEDDVIISFDDDIRKMTLIKIRAIFSACANNGADVLILGALGCGQFSNPPQEVPDLFKQVAQEYAGHFSNIFFSILDNKQSVENTAYIFAERIIGQGAGNMCASVHHQNIADVVRCGTIYTPTQTPPSTVEQ